MCLFKNNRLFLRTILKHYSTSLLNRDEHSGQTYLRTKQCRPDFIILLFIKRYFPCNCTQLLLFDLVDHICQQMIKKTN